MASKSLGTLTLDLIAKTAGFAQGMSKAERDSAKWRKKVKRDIKDVSSSIAKWGAATAAAAATASTALVVHTAKSAAEISKLSAVAGTSTDQFQRYAAGARVLGIEQEKLADIFKDTSDKVGDFLQTGGGPLADFFNNIAPKVGVTAEQFRNLSGPQALELYTASLEKANISQNEMTFFMEAIASDASMLLPLLRDGAKGFETLGEAAAQSGAILSKDLIADSERFNAALFLMEQQSVGLKNQFVSGLMPTFTDLATKVADVTVETGVAKEVGETFGNVLKGVAVAAVGLVGGLQIMGKSIGTIAAAVSAASEGELNWFERLLPPPAQAAKKVYDNFDAIKAAFESGREDMALTFEKYGSIIDAIIGGEGEGDGQDQVNRIAEFMRRAREQVEAGMGAATGSTGAGADDPIHGRLAALRTSLMEESQVLGEKFVNDNLMLQEALEKDAITRDEYNMLTLERQAQYEQQMTDLQKKAHEQRQRGLKNALSAASTLMNGESRKMFEIGKVAAIANATINMYEGVMEAWALGPILGPPMAALVAAAGVMNIRSIAATKFGGGSSGAATASVSASAAPAQTIQDQAPARNVYLHGIDKDSLYSGSQILDLLDKELMNGGRLAGIV